MTPVDHLKGLLCISGCFWGLFGLYGIFSVKTFIVKRYEEETDLIRTKFFTQHMPFAKNMPSFLSSSLYCGHLLSFIWGWKFIRYIKAKRPKITYYNDIGSPEFVTHHFSTREIRRVKLVAIIAMVLFLHGIAFYVFQLIWPEVFN